MLVAQNELSLITKLPPETVIAISEFVAEPRTRKSTFEVVKMTQICQYWRSTLISYPYLWSSIFVKNDHKDFVAACLERSRELPLTVSLDLKHGDYDTYPDCTCIRNEWSPGMRVDENNPCRYHTTIHPLLDIDHSRRIRELDVHLDMLDDSAEEPDQDFRDALYNFGFFVFLLPSLKSLSFSVDHQLDADEYLELPDNLFLWSLLPPDKLRHLTLHGCYGGPILAVRNLTSFELAGDEDQGFDRIALNHDSFLPLITGSPSLVSLTLEYCSFTNHERSSRVAPVKLPKLKSLQLKDVRGLSDFVRLIEVPALESLSSIHVSTRKHVSLFQEVRVYFEVRAENDDGFHLLYETPDGNHLGLEWVGLTRIAGSSPSLVRFEGQGPCAGIDDKREVSLLPLFINARILEIAAPFAGFHRGFWMDVEKIGPQLTTLRLEIVEEMAPEVATSVKEFVETRFRRGMPLAKMERMEFEGMSEGEEEKAKKLWEEFRASLGIDQYLAF